MTGDGHQPLPDGIMEAAATWLARRDRGLNAAEQDDYMQWLGADPRHAEALQQHAAALERMMQLYEWTPAHDTEPNPNLFAPGSTRRRPWIRWAGAALAAAAVLAVGLFLREHPWFQVGAAPAAAPHFHLRVNERLALPDGSRVELKDGTRLVVQYSENERRVQLTGGEAHFHVWKDPTRPFVVVAAGVEVCAVGTAFNVQLEARQLQILVTEGRISITPPPATAALPPATAADPARTPLYVSVGQRATVDLQQPDTPAIAPISAAEVARALAWQAPRLEFNETLLAEAVAAFNRLNRHQLEIGDPALRALRIGGTFRPDNVEGFIRALGPTLGVRGERVTDDRTVLRRSD